MKIPSLSHPQRNSYFFLDLLKAIASNLIVLHHLAFYGPMADHAEPLAPLLIGWLDEHARIAVQVFLVIGGFLAARTLSPKALPGLPNPLQAVRGRFMKLVPPYLVALMLAMGASAVAQAWMNHYSISAPPTLAQLVAHAFLLQDILGYEALSAGIWYIAIDFQLYALLIVLLWMAGRYANGNPNPWLVPSLVTVGVAASLLHVNLDSAWDVWALYFFGSYGLGVLAWWAADKTRSMAQTAVLIAVPLSIAGAALAIDFRSRIAVALVTACALVVVHRIRLPGLPGLPASGQRLPMIGFLGRISYAVFLVHFPVCLVVNAAFTRFAPAEAWVQAGGMLVAWGASIVGGAVFHRWVELPLSRGGAPVPAVR